MIYTRTLQNSTKTVPRFYLIFCRLCLIREVFSECVMTSLLTNHWHVIVYALTNG